MKTILKFIKVALLTFLIAILALVVVAWSVEKQITQMAIKKTSETLKVPFGIEEVSFSLIRDFPMATFKLKGVWIGGPSISSDSAQTQVIDTLARFDNLFISVESRPLLDNIFNIQEIEARSGHIKYLVNETGVTCLDFLLNTDTTTLSQDTVSSAKPDITLDQISLKDVTCNYRDDKLNAKAYVYISEIEGMAKIDSTTMRITAKGGMQLTKCSFEKTNLHMMQQADLQFDILYDPDSLTFNKIKIETEGAVASGSGKLFLGDTIATDLSIAGSGLDIKELSKYLPAEVYEMYDLSKISGNLDLRGMVSGVLSDSIMPYYDAAFALTNGSIQYQDYPVMKDIEINGTATNGQLQNNATTAISIDDLQLNADNNHIHLTGTLHNLDQLHYDLNADLDIDLQTCKPYIPDTLVQDVKGQLSANIATSGILPDSIDDQFIDYLLETSRADFHFNNVDIDLDSTLSFSKLSGLLRHNATGDEFELNGFNIHIPEQNLTLVNNSIKGRLNGKLTKPDSLGIDLTSYHLATQNSSVSGTATIRNLNHPSYALQSALNIDLSEAKKFIPDSLVKNMKGNVVAHIDSEGMLDLDALPRQIEDLAYDHSTFDMDLKNISLDMQDTLLNVQKLSGHVNVNPEVVTFKNLSGNYQGVDFQIDTTVVKQLFTTVLRNKPGKLEIAGVYRLGDLDYDMIDQLTAEDTTRTANGGEPVDKVDDEHSITRNNSQNSTGESWNKDFEFKGKLYVNSLKYKKALLEDISTLFNIQDSVYKFDQLVFKAFDGVMDNAIRIDLTDDGRHVINIRNHVDQVNIRTLFQDMEDFGQTEMTHKNISGVLSSEQLFTRIVMEGDSVIYPEIRMTGDFLMEKGGIYNFEPIEILAPNIPGVDRLDTLKFKTIKSHAFIFKDTICIPETYVISNVFDISAVGMQSFGMDYEYHLGVHLGDVLFSKSKKRNKKQASIEGAITKSKRNTKWIQSFIDDEGKPRNKIIYDKKLRTLMILAVKARKVHLDMRFYPKVVSFETDIDEELIKK